MQEGSIDSCFHGKFSLGSLHFHTLEFDPWIGLDLLACITCIVLYKLSRKIHRVLKIPIWFVRQLLNNSCVLYCAAVSEKYEDQSQRNPYVTLSRLAPHFEDEIAGLQKRPFLAGFELFWTHFVCM